VVGRWLSSLANNARCYGEQALSFVRHTRIVTGETNAISRHFRAGPQVLSGLV
jgi:hypothetical protein